MVEPGATVTVHLVVGIVEGEGPERVVETTDLDVALGTETYDAQRDYEPVEFEVGAGEVPAAIDGAVRGMEVGERRAVELSPEEAFGARSEAHEIEVPVGPSGDASEREAEAGTVVQSTRGQVGWIDAVVEDDVTIDPDELAGDRVLVEFRLLDVSGGTDAA